MTPCNLRNISESVVSGQWLVVSAGDFSDAWIAICVADLATDHCLADVRIFAVTLPIRLLAVDIDGTLLNSQFHISQADLGALRRAHETGVEVLLVTGRRHAFALPIAQQLGFDLWLISSNGAVTRSLSGEEFTIHRLCGAHRRFAGDGPGAGHVLWANCAHAGSVGRAGNKRVKGADHGGVDGVSCAGPVDRGRAQP